MGFDGFSDKDFDTYKPAHRTSATFTLQRRQVKDKLRALMTDVMTAVGEEARGLELTFSSETPSLENGRSVADQGAYLVRTASERVAVKALVEKMSMSSATALDVAEFHKHAALGVVVDENGVHAQLAFHPRGRVDRQNLKAKLAEAWAQDALVQLFKNLPAGFSVMLGAPMLVAPADVTADMLTETIKVLDGDAPLAIIRQRSREDSKGALTDGLVADLKTLLAIYRFGAWATDHDHIQAVKAAKAQREEARKGTDLLPGAKIRILSGMWSGKQGVVEAVDKKGGLRVLVGAVTVKIDVKDAQPV
jgi:hypothetical protein